ncbi:MAG: hypothetical protein V4627_09205 [Pseudomonadota bacterium]
MNPSLIIRAAILTAASGSLFIAGCASTVVKEDHLQQKTAFALGLEPNSFTVADRVDDGLQTHYSVKTNDGRRFNCYVEGSFSFGTGRVVTDAICSPIGKTANSAGTGGSGGTGGPACNALLKAAGKC